MDLGACKNLRAQTVVEDVDDSQPIVRRMPGEPHPSGCGPSIPTSEHVFTMRLLAWSSWSLWPRSTLWRQDDPGSQLAFARWTDGRS